MLITRAEAAARPVASVRSPHHSQPANSPPTRHNPPCRCPAAASDPAFRSPSAPPVPTAAPFSPAAKAARSRSGRWWPAPGVRPFWNRAAPAPRGGSRPQRRHRLFNRRQADHFAGDLGEAAQPAQDGDVAVGVDRDDVAGVVPAAAAAGSRGAVTLQIGPHQIGAGDPQPAAVLDAFHRLQPQAMAGRKRPTVPGLK